MSYNTLKSGDSHLNITLTEEWSDVCWGGLLKMGAPTKGRPTHKNTKKKKHPPNKKKKNKTQKTAHPRKPNKTKKKKKEEKKTGEGVHHTSQN